MKNYKEPVLFVMDSNSLSPGVTELDASGDISVDFDDDWDL